MPSEKGIAVDVRINLPEQAENGETGGTWFL